MTTPENGTNIGPRNDFLRLADQIIEETPEYTRGAESIKEFVNELIGIEFLPEEVILKTDMDSTPPSQKEVEKKDPIYHHMYFDYDSNHRTVTLLNGEVIDLTETENAVLEFLSSRPNEVIGYKEIVEHVWGDPQLYDTQFLRTWVSRLRKKIPLWESEKEHSVIKSKHNVGYEFYDPSKIKQEIVEREEIKVVEIPLVKEVVVYKHRLFIFTPSLRKIESNNANVKLTPTENRFLEALSETVLPYVSHEALMDRLPKDAYQDIDPSVASIHNYISKLRKIFKEELGVEENVIETITGKGFNLLP